MLSKVLRSLLVLGLGLSHAQVRDGDSFCAISSSESCAVEKISPSQLDSSVVIYPGGNTRCAFDDWSSSETDFATNATYFFQVFPNAKLDKTKLLIYFQGGSTCLNPRESGSEEATSGSPTCNFALDCATTATFNWEANAKALSSGVLNRSDSDNVFNDWNIVHIPYCTGDLHVGNSVYPPNDTVFFHPPSPSYCLDQNLSMHMNGYNNTNSALSWTLANFPHPEQIVVAGSNTGSLASQIVSAYVADLWQAEKNAIKYSVLADSYVGVLPNNTPVGGLLSYYGSCSVDLKFPAAVSSKCDDQSSLTIKDIVLPLITSIPFASWLFVDSIADETQRNMYHLAQDGVYLYPFPEVDYTASEFNSAMQSIVQAYQAASKSVSSFFVDSTQNVFLLSHYADYPAQGNQTQLGSFIGTWLGVSDSSSSSNSSGTAAGSTTSGSDSVSTHQLALLLLVATALCLAL